MAKGMKLFLLSLLIPGLLTAQTPTEIVPLKSNCADVERVFGVLGCNPRGDYFRLADESVEVQYINERCQRAFGTEWNVAPGTVLSITRFFKRGASLKDFRVDFAKCSRTQVASHLPNQFIYHCPDVGIEVYVDGRPPKPMVHTLIYGPKSKDHCLACKRTGAFHQNEYPPFQVEVIESLRLGLFEWHLNVSRRDEQTDTQNGEW